ncbi:MAG TPA: uroporphyrinogen-III synthase [Candidatus Dormibacteraeota bacterium]|nr:uroporphyrinogen-III synthase [Candidatus Dormibacteraeota bacterium]
MTSDDRPLQGRRIVVTRSARQSAELAARLETLGAQVLLLPLIEFAPPDDTEALDRALIEMASFDWLFLTSGNAVRFLADRARAVSLDLAAKLAGADGRPRVATVGPETATAAREQNWRVDRVSGGRGGLDLARELSGELRGCRILLPRSQRAMSELPRALVEAGAAPVEVVAYKTLATEIDPAILNQIERGEVDALSFASPSAFSALVDGIGLEKLRQMTLAAHIAAMGPTTAAAIRRRGLAVAIEARVPTDAGLAAAIAAHFARHEANPGGSQ